MVYQPADDLGPGTPFSAWVRRIESLRLSRGKPRVASEPWIVTVAQDQHQHQQGQPRASGAVVWVWALVAGLVVMLAMVAWGGRRWLTRREYREVAAAEGGAGP
jgi:hypothetical protein